MSESTNTNHLLPAFESYQKSHPHHASMVKTFTDFAQSGNTPQGKWFDRSREDGHFTASAFVVNKTGEKTLLTHHKKLNKWLQPGGHADGDADLKNVALKEAMEETGLDKLELVGDIFDLDAHPFPARDGMPEHTHFDVRYVIRHTGDGSYTVSDESHDLAWVDITEVATGSQYSPSLRRMAQKWLAQN